MDTLDLLYQNMKRSFYAWQDNKEFSRTLLKEANNIIANIKLDYYKAFQEYNEVKEVEAEILYAQAKKENLTGEVKFLKNKKIFIQAVIEQYGQAPVWEQDNHSICPKAILNNRTFE